MDILEESHDILDGRHSSLAAADTPILSALIQTAQSERHSLHVPGHKTGRLFPNELGMWLGRALSIDLTELPGLDNLHQPTECIAQSQKLAGLHYGSGRTWYSVNGSSAGIMAAILALASDRKVLVLGPYHQSLWRGLVLADADAVFVTSDWDEVTLEPLPPNPSQVRAALSEHPDVSCVFVTSPTYTGRVADVAGLAAEAHEAGVPLVVDEAHGAHFGLHPKLPPHSVAAGADVVIQSAHKMLPALTQTAWVHASGNRIDFSRLEDALHTLTSTSPSYLLLASLDAAQAWLRTRGFREVDASLNVLGKFPLTRPKPHRDPFRLWLPTGSLAVSQRIEAVFAERGLFVEYANHLGVLCMFGLRVTYQEVTSIADALFRAYPCKEGDVRESTDLADILAPRFVHLDVRPRVLETMQRDAIHLKQAIGRIAARMIVPYPPGVPVVHPGQRIDADIVEMLSGLHDSGARILGLGEDRTIEVVR